MSEIRRPLAWFDMKFIIIITIINNFLLLTIPDSEESPPDLTLSGAQDLSRGDEMG